MQSLDNQGVHQRQHQRGIGAGDVADPLRAGFLGQVFAQRADMHEPAAVGAGARHGAALDMLADAAAGHHAVLQRHAAEGDHDLAMRDDLFPAHVALRHLLVVADDVGDQHRGSAGTIGIDRPDITSHRHVEKAMHLALRVVKAARARPAVGAAEHRARTISVPHPRQLGAEQVERVVPGQRNKFVASPACAWSTFPFQPSPAHHRLRDARAMPQGAWEILDQAVRIGIVRMRPNLQFVVLPARRKHAPMRGMRPEPRVGRRSGT